MDDFLWQNLAGQENVPGLLGIFLLALFGIDRLTRAVLYFVPVERLIGRLERRLLGKEDGETRESAIGYYVVAFFLSLFVVGVGNIRLLGLLNPGFTPVLDNILSAVVVATGGEGLSQLLELGEPGRLARAAPTAPQPLQVLGDVNLSSGGEPAEETTEG